MCVHMVSRKGPAIGEPLVGASTRVKKTAPKGKRVERGRVTCLAGTQFDCSRMQAVSLTSYLPSSDNSKS